MAEKISVSAFRPLSVKERAEEFGISVDALQDCMITETGMSLHDFIINLRMETAQKLLAATTIPVGLVGSRVGYEDPSYFSRLFRRKVGVPPTQFRNQEKLH
ncbi:helix-turn-helix domain-containing protein [Nocardiopsis nanhaiensis]